MDLVVTDPLGSGSATALFTLLAPDDVARGLEIATVDLQGLPRVVDVSPDGRMSLVATDEGLAAIDVQIPGSPVLHFLPVTGGLNDLDVSPDGSSIYGVSQTNEMLYRFRYDRSIMPPQNPVALLDEIPLGDIPRGVVIDPSGKSAYVTMVGEVQIWDINPSSSTFQFQVGALRGSGPVLLGPAALDPGGRYLVATAGSGKIVVFDPREGTIVAQIELQTNPVDIQFDPTGSTAYVTDDNGYLSVVDMNGLVKVRDILTGGSLQGSAITPTASFIYAANHQADDLDVIDLRSGSATHLGVATRIPSRVNPIDVTFSSDGIYAYSLVEYERKFVITAMGAGPLLDTLQPAWGPPGSRVVLSGSGFSAASVSFNGASLPIDHGTDEYLAVTIPAGAVSGPITVVGADAGEISNSLQFTVLEPDEGGVLTDNGTFRPPGEPAFAGVLSVGSHGRTVAVGGDDGQLYLFDADAASSGYRQFADPVDLFVGPVSGLTMSPDGMTVYAVSSDSDEMKAVDANPDNESFGEVTRILPVGGEGLGRLAAGPTGRYLLAADRYEQILHIIELASGYVLDVAIAGGMVGEISFHPGGQQAYLALLNDNPAAVAVVDMDDQGEGFGTILNVVELPGGDPSEIPVSISCTPDGGGLYVLTSQLTGATNRTVLLLDITDPGNPGVPLPLGVVSTEALPLDEQLKVSPAGDRLIISITGQGIYQAGIDPYSQGAEPEVSLGLGEAALAFSPDGSLVYAVDVASESLRLFDFGGDRRLSKVWGSDQTAVAGQQTASSLRVRVTDLAGVPVPGAAVTFEVSGGGGTLASTQPLNSGDFLTLATDIYGYAQVDWTLGSALGLQEVTVTSAGAAGSPVLFSGTAVEDPDLLPLVLVENLFNPLDGAVDVSVTTAIQATFSRAVDVVSIHPDSYFLWDQATATKVPTVIGFADGNHAVSLTPLSGLGYGASYSVIIGSAVRDLSGGSLTNFTDISFTTEAAPPSPVLAAVNPTSAIPIVDIVLSGTGFDPVPANNQVVFVNGETLAEVTAYVADGATDYLRATVPIGTWEGTVYVTGPAGSSNALPFNILEESTQPADEVLGRVATGSPTKAVTVSPDGATAYAISPEADQVVPVDLNTLASLASIPVGDEPWAVAVHPAGTFIYVANRLSGDVSVVDILPGSGSLHEVVATMNVGAEPVDIVVTPDGDRVIVANWGSDDLSIIDTDESSASFHNVIGTVRTGTPTRTVTVSPDGGRVYVGTDDGYLVMGTLDYGVIGRVTTGTGTKTLTVTPDGTLLVLLDVTGGITIYDIAPGSETENQVIASVRTGSGAKTATVSPDGALLYVVMNENDTIQIFNLEVDSSIGVLGTQAVRPIEFLMLVATITAGENPEDLSFVGGDTGGFVVSNSGDNTMTVYGGFTPGILSGRVYADCPEPGTGLAGVKIDVFQNDTGDLFTTLITDSLGYYEEELPAGQYNVTLLTPLAYFIDEEVVVVDIGGGQSGAFDWILECQDIIPSQRAMSYWKHRIGEVLKGEKDDEVGAETLCSFLDIIEGHFNNHAINQVVIYDPPASGECLDKLLVAKELLNLRGYEGMVAHARQQAMALLFNVASGRISLLEVVSEDGATLSRAITYLDILIDDGVTRNDVNATLIAKYINHGLMVPAGPSPIWTSL
jgi:YVTN family beta-propeller protein